MHAVLERLAALPPAALYAVLAVASALENFFPPLPTDTVVAFGSFLAARGDATMLGAFLATWTGNVSGAMGVYALGRRYGAAEMRRRMRHFGGAEAERRLEHFHRRRGLVALFLSRFLPGVRALVPPFAGALRMHPVPVFVVIGGASALWYGLITVLAYEAGADWNALRDSVAALSRTAAIVAGVVVVVAGAAWLLLRRRHRR